MNDDNINRITENLARLADILAYISIEIEKVDSDLAYHSNNVASDLANISSRIERVESGLDYQSNIIASDLASIPSRIDRVENSLNKLPVSYLPKPFQMYHLKNFATEHHKRN